MKIARKVINMPTPNSIDAHVGLLHLLGSIVKRGGGVLHGCYCHYHFGSENGTVRALNALRLYLEYLTHKHSVFKLSYMIYANERNESCFQIAQMQVYQVAKVGNICEPNKFIMVHKRKKNGANPTFPRSFYVSIYQISTYRTE